MKKKSSIPDLKTDANMCKPESVAYCENYYHYCFHIVTYFQGFDGELNDEELAELRYIVSSIKRFLGGSACEPYTGRYRRLLKKMVTLTPDSNEDE